MLGIVEGITEFLPISSTFHLIFVGKILGVPQNEFTSLFEVFIQSGAILSVVFLYFKDIIKDMELAKKALASFIPTAIVGLVLHKIIKTVFFQSSWLMIAVFFIMAIVFFVVEYLIRSKKLKVEKNIAQVDYKMAVLIGLAQSLAVIPGVSRAGSVIVAMMFLGVRRDEAAKYSFILSIPTIFAASALDLFQMRHVVSSNMNNAGLLLIGFVVAFASSYGIVKWFIGYLQKHSLDTFGWYRIVAGIMVVTAMMFGLIR